MLRSFKKTAAVTKFIMVVTIALLVWAPCVSAQEQRITLNLTQMSVGELFGEIEKQSGLLFAINHANFDTSRVVALPAEAQVAELIRLALVGTSMTYRITGQHVMIVSRREEQTMKQSKKILAASSFYDSQNNVYNNPDFENDLIVYNTSIVGHYTEKEKQIELLDSIHIMYVPRVDSIFIYPDSTFPVNYVNAKAETPQAMNYLNSRPAKLTLKTNLLYGATLTPNLSLEIGLGRRTSLDLTGSYNPWKRKGTREDNAKLVHWTARPEFRYWLCERSNGHFFGANVFYWQYNIAGHDLPLLFKREFRYEGFGVGGGLSYGYHLSLAKRWGLEFNVGAGVVFMKYDRYSCDKCSRDKESLKKIYFGPTDLGVKLVFIIK